ncbi:TetR/AcrR family transcriptional regulator [Nonomuraea sp. SBT364]|uniref:TetR/AcrR family transcriptional regulator n=1 Tax=Nonomuraea sp. SBT364 TaxID=1580530 RepID=UPI00066CC2AB
MARGPGAHQEQRRAEIADAVLAIVADRGLQAVSLTEVAARAGVSHGRVQHYFPAKEQLIAAAFDRGNALSSARIDAELGHDAAGAPARQVLTVVLCELIPYDAATRAHLRVRQSFAALALADEAIAGRLRADYDRFHRQMADLIRRDHGHDRDAEAEAVSLVALAEGLAYYVLIGLTPAGSARDRVLAAIAALYA